MPDALAEVREAVDFCATTRPRARADFASPQPLPGPTGERNQLALHGRGVFVCIRPWNFPLAIFTGQVAAALAAGNAVIAKPAEQTPLIAAAAVRLLHEAGVPATCCSCCRATAQTVGAALVADPRIAGVAFTGSTETARPINRDARRAATAPIVAADRRDRRAERDDRRFLGAARAGRRRRPRLGLRQRRPALLGAARAVRAGRHRRPRCSTMLTGAMAELAIGDPALLATDVGPVIDDAAREALERHVDAHGARGPAASIDCTLPAGTEHGTFFAPRAFEIDSARRGSKREVFGPVLHVVRWQADRLDAVIDDDQRHRLRPDPRPPQPHRRDHRAHRRAGSQVGNIYVNRNMIGAVVGVQPFGGEAAVAAPARRPAARTTCTASRPSARVSIDTTAAGGNASAAVAQRGRVSGRWARNRREPGRLPHVEQAPASRPPTAPAKSARSAA